MDPVINTLNVWFGHSAFRPGQEELVRSILSGRDTLGILPTGGGKSICYQVPSLIFPGMTLVISPLISLMADQVEKLLSAGIPAACLSSAQSAEERRQILARCLQGYPAAAAGPPGTIGRSPQTPLTGPPGQRPQDPAGFRPADAPFAGVPFAASKDFPSSSFPSSFSAGPPGPPGPERRAFAMSRPPRLLYLSPERLLTEEFRRAAQALNISFICVDEAHCISQWGENFRPAYRRIPEFLSILPRRPALAAFTATATPAVRRDIEKCLGLRDPFVRTTGFDRPNLFYRICRVRDKWPALLKFLDKYRGQCGVVYCLTRRTTESVARGLCRAGVSAACYHGGLSKEARDRAQEAWLSGEVEVMAATCAFGMGIDKPNVRFVIHYQMSGSVENYYQEAGRAGRDGKPSDCVLLYSFRDVVVNRFFANQDSGEVRKNELRKLLDMRRYAASKGCHRAWLLNYFGEEAPSFCGKCSFCLGMAIRHFQPEEERAQEDEDLRKELRALRLRLAKKKKILPHRIFQDNVLQEMAHLRPTSFARMLLLEGAGIFHILRWGRPFLEEIRIFEETR